MEIVGMEMAHRRAKHLFWTMVRAFSAYHVSCRGPSLAGCVHTLPARLPVADFDCVSLLPQMHQEDLRFVRRCLEAFAGKESYQWLLAEVEGVDEEEMDAANGDNDDPSVVPANGSAGANVQEQQQQQPAAASSPKEPEGEQPLPSAAKALVTCRSKIIRDPTCSAVVLPWWLPPERVPPEVTGGLLLSLPTDLSTACCSNRPEPMPSPAPRCPPSLSCATHNPLGYTCCCSGVGHHRHRARQFVLPHAQARAGQVCHRPPSLGVSLPVRCPRDCGWATSHQVGGQDCAGLHPCILLARAYYHWAPARSPCTCRREVWHLMRPHKLLAAPSVVMDIAKAFGLTPHEVLAHGNSLDPKLPWFYKDCQSPGPGADLVASQLGSAFEVLHCPLQVCMQCFVQPRRVID